MVEQLERLGDDIVILFLLQLLPCNIEFQLWRAYNEWEVQGLLKRVSSKDGVAYSLKSHRLGIFANWKADYKISVLNVQQPINLSCRLIQGN